MLLQGTKKYNIKLTTFYTVLPLGFKLSCGKSVKYRYIEFYREGRRLKDFLNSLRASKGFFIILRASYLNIE